MTAVEGTLLALTLAAAGGFAAWIYLRREPAVPRRAVLAALRGAALLILVLLVWNPRLPWGGEGGEDGPPAVVLLDASLSMTARDSSGTTAWEQGVEAAREAAGGDEVVFLFGSRVRAADGPASGPAPPGDEESRLAPALERAAALGAGRVRVVSDLRLQDPVGAAEAVRELALPVEVRRVGGAVRNAGVGDLSIPPAARAGETVRATFLLHGEGGAAGDSVELTARRGDRLLARRRVALPAAGRPRREALEFPAPDARGPVPVTVGAELAGDAFDADDRAPGVLVVDPERGGVLLLSSRPDWEPRYLLPVLEQVTGLRVRGYLSLADERWLPMGRMEGRGGPVEAAAVRRRVEGAEVLVLHGLDAAAPGWATDALGGAGRALVFVADGAGAERLGLEVAPPRVGEWYVSPELPPSPLAGELAGVSLEGLPPLTSVLPLLEEHAGRVPLRLQRGRSGPPEAALLLRRRGERRTAVALASGFWRWAAREGTARETYRRLWSGVAGWLLAADAGAGTPAVAAPNGPVLRQRPVAWRVRGLDGDSVRIRVLAGDTAVTDTTVVPRAGAPVRTAPVPPGSYRWEAAAEPLEGGGASGTLLVSGRSEELFRLPTEAADLEGAGGPAAGSDSPGGGDPLRTRALPYLLLLALLCVEWIGRRRQGLR